MTRAVALWMVEQGFAHIVNNVPINGLRGRLGEANCSAAQAGLTGLIDMARTLPKEVLVAAGLAPRGSI